MLDEELLLDDELDFPDDEDLELELPDERELDEDLLELVFELELEDELEDEQSNRSCSHCSQLMDSHWGNVNSRQQRIGSGIWK